MTLKESTTPSNVVDNIFALTRKTRKQQSGSEIRLGDHPHFTGKIPLLIQEALAETQGYCIPKSSIRAPD